MDKNILTTVEIENHIKKEISKSPYADELNKYLAMLFHFTNKLSWQGTYIYSDEEGYHIIHIGDRGERHPDEKPKTLEDICWRVHETLAFNVESRIPEKLDENSRLNYFKKRLEILATIDEKYFILAQKDMERTLYAAPIGHSLTLEEIDGRYKEYDSKQDISKGESLDFTTTNKIIIQRYGDPNGRFSSPDGTPAPELSLPPTTNINNITRWEVIKEIPNVESSIVAPWFDQPGGGTQFFFQNHNGSFRSIEWLRDNGFIRQLP